MTVSRPWSGPDRRVSPLNWVPEVRALYDFREPLVIQDFTFGKMDHLFGAPLYAVDDYRVIGQLLEDLHMPETLFLTGRYAGTPRDETIWAGFRAVAKLKRRHLKVRAFVFLEYLRPKAYREEVDKLVAAGADALYFHFFALGSHRSQEEVDARLREVPEAFAYAAGRGMPIAITISNTTGEDLDAVMDRINYYVDSGIQAIELADSVGRTTPEATRYLISSVRQRLSRDIPIWYHAHDNLGLATALALAATSAGAWPQASAGGIADHGFASLEEVVMALELLYDVRTGIVLEGLPDLARTVERITGVRNPPYKAVSGAHVSLHEDVGRYMGTIQGRTHLELLAGPFALELVGLKPDLAISYASLTDEVVKLKLERLGLPSAPTEVTRARAALLARLDSIEERYPRLIPDAEVDQICREAATRS